MKFKIEIRYAVLITLLMFLWLTLEFMLGFHDRYIQYHPIVTLFAFIIPVICSYLAIKEKNNQLENGITFNQAFSTGFMIALFAAVLAIPSQLFFHKLINPYFFKRMIDYSVTRASFLHVDVAQAQSQAEIYFNLTSYTTQCFLGTLFFGTIIALVMAWRMRTVK